MNETNNQSSQSGKFSNKFQLSSSSLDQSSGQVSNHNYMDNDLDSNHCHT